MLNRRDLVLLAATSPANDVASRASVTGYHPGIVEDLYFFRTITKS